MSYTVFLYTVYGSSIWFLSLACRRTEWCWRLLEWYTAATPTSPLLSELHCKRPFDRRKRRVDCNKRILYDERYCTMRDRLRYCTYASLKYFSPNRFNIEVFFKKTTAFLSVIYSSLFFTTLHFSLTNDDFDLWGLCFESHTFSHTLFFLPHCFFS